MNKHVSESDEPKNIISDDYLSNLFLRLKKSKYGKKLMGKVRYEVYKPGSVSNKEWERFLGPNANNLHHMWNTYLQAQNFLSKSSLNEVDKAQIYLAAVIHDVGEAIIGDINYADKNGFNEKLEQQAAVNIIEELAKTEVEASMLVENFNQVAFSRRSRLGEMFNALEKLGYLSDAIHVTHVQQLDPELPIGSELIEARKNIVNSNIPLQTEALIAYADKHDFVRIALASTQQKITILFQYLLPENQKYSDMWRKYYAAHAI